MQSLQQFQLIQRMMAMEGINIQKYLLIQSRSSLLPFNIDELINRPESQSRWFITPNDQPTGYHENQDIGNKVGIILYIFFEGKNIKILEVFCGNCITSSFIQGHINALIYIATDINEYECEIDNHTIQFECHSASDSVITFGESANVLLMVCPPPSSSMQEGNCYQDYHAIKLFIELNKNKSEDKWIVFVGELGAGDGSEGMYMYLLNDCQDIILEHRETIYLYEDSMNYLHREIFIFKLI